MKYTYYLFSPAIRETWEKLTSKQAIALMAIEMRCILCSWLAQHNQGAVSVHLQMNLVFKIQPWARWQSEAAVVGERHSR